jgi:hypothetical protein
VVSRSANMTVDPSPHMNIQTQRAFPAHLEKSASAFRLYSPGFAHSALHTNPHAFGGFFGRQVKSASFTARSSPGITHSTQHTSARSH